MKPEDKLLQEFVEEVKLSVLHFMDSSGNEYIIDGYTDLFDLILECIDSARLYRSFSNGKMETRAGCWRSVLDIWRHVKLYEPNISIFDVMREIYKNQSQISSFICPDIRRRIFYRKYNYEEISDKFYKDEFGLYFNQWSDIGLEE